MTFGEFRLVILKVNNSFGMLGLKLGMLGLKLGMLGLKLCTKKSGFGDVGFEIID